jgi:hypothetical protein
VLVVSGQGRHQARAYTMRMLTNRGCRAPVGAAQVPFTLACGVPGRFRWVTTFIARFDPSIPWPPDLQCALKWNTRLTSYDGARPTRPPCATGPAQHGTPQRSTRTNAPAQVGVMSMSARWV